MAAAALWQPQEEGLREICGLLEQHISPTSDQQRIWQQLQHYSQFPDFNNYLAYIFTRGEVCLEAILTVFPWRMLMVSVSSPMAADGFLLFRVRNAA